jgi:signal transduction histidine kinase
LTATNGEEVVFDSKLRLEEIVDRSALDELCKSFHTLFGIPVRIYSSERLLLGSAASEHEVCAYVSSLKDGRARCGETVDAVKNADPDASGDVEHPCFTGQSYRVIAIEYDGRRVGKMILGPFLPHALQDAPDTLLAVDPEIDREKARVSLLRAPRAKSETITRIAAHLKAALDLIMFSGHKSLLTSTMHLASVRESYRELQEKTQKLQEAYDRLKELDRLKSNFLATVSHELRTPLTSIIGYSEMLTEGLAGDLNDEQRDFVKTIHEKGEQLLGLIMSLLDLSKLESGTMTMRRRPTQIGTVLNEVLTTVTPNARKKGVTVTIDDDKAPCELRCDPDRLRQVFINLADNAIKFTPAGGTITLEARTVQGSDGAEEGSGFAVLAPAHTDVIVRVIDTGIGIPHRLRERVFDPFYQVDSSSTREHGGAGLGLAIVRRIVEAHGGTISIEDNQPQGTIFVVKLPSATSPPIPRRSSLPPPMSAQ